MCALVTGVQTCALPIWLLRRDRSFFPSSFSALLMPFKEGCKVKLVWSMCREVAKLNLMPIPRRTHKRSSSSDGSPEFGAERSEEHTSELQSLMRNSYAVFCLQKQTTHIKVKI